MPHCPPPRSKTTRRPLPKPHPGGFFVASIEPASYGFLLLEIHHSRTNQQWSCRGRGVQGTGGVAVGCAVLSTIVVMLMTPPRSTRDWAVGLISTVVTGIGGGAIAVQYFRPHE